MSTPLSRRSEDELRDHAPWLRRVARSLVASESEAEDLAQDVWVELARGAGPIAHLRGLSARIARRLAGHRRAAEGARERREARVARPEALPGTDELEDALEIQRLLLEELTALQEVHRTPLLLHFYEGLSAAEIARRRGVAASTVRSQIARALQELRARLDRRHGGRRELWVGLVVRLSRPEAAAGGVAAGGLFMTILGKCLLVAGALGALAVAWRFVRPVDERAEPVVADAALPVDLRSATPPTEPSGPLDEPEASAQGRSVAAVAAQARGIEGDVSVLVLDEATELPLPDFDLTLENDRDESMLTTDAQGRTAFPARWFDGEFALELDGDREAHESFGSRELGPADRPADGEELVLRCATGPSYTLLFDTPPPSGAELIADLSAGSVPPEKAHFTAGLHRDGTRIRARFAPPDNFPSALGDGPWTLTVFALDGLWRAHGPVHTIVGEQREPVLLVSEACGALQVELECDVAPQKDSFHISLYRIVENESVEPRHENFDGRQRSFHFRHLTPGEYQVWAGSPVHETAGARVTLAPSEDAKVGLTLSAKVGVAALRVVITSQSGTLDLAPIGAEARELGGILRKHARWIDEGTATRRVLLFEGLALADHEVTLNGLGRFGNMGVTPGRSALARPGAAELVFTVLDAGAPPLRTGQVRALTRAGEPTGFTDVTTYFDGRRSYQHGAATPRMVQLEQIVEGTRFDLLVGAEGFRPKYLRDLALPFDGDRLDVHLDPGWGTWLDVVLAPGSGSDPSPHPAPAAGASVRVDGVFAGHLDERGQLLLEGDASPAKIEIDYPGYRVAYGNIDPESGAPTEGVDAQWVVLEPDPAAEER